MTVDMGWALKASRKSVRFSEKVKAHLLELFLRGEETGHKSEPTDVAAHIRKDKRFTKEDWLSATKVKSYFSRLTSLQRAGKQLQGTINEDTAAEEAESDRYNL